MAEGGKWSRSFLDSFSKASGDADELFCDPCKHMGKHIAVGGYCPICDEYLCENCLEVHRNLKITRAHPILDKKDMPSQQESTSNQDLCVDVCKTHHPEIVRYYCTAHDEPGCSDCMTLNHASCKKDRVQDISSGFKTTKEFADIDTQLQQLHQEVEKMEGELDNNLKELDTTYNNILQKITTVRKQINENLDETQKKVTDKAAQMWKEDKTELNKLQNENQAMKDEIEAILKTLHDSNVNLNSIFVITKQAKHRLSTMEEEMNKMKQSQQQQYEFHVSDEIKNIVSAITPLGKLSRRSSQKRTEMTKKQYQKMPRTPTIDATAAYNRSINVKCETDKNDCRITDCTVLSPDRMVVADKNNMNVKLIDLSNNTVVSCYSMSGEPLGVTALSTSMIAVTLSNQGKIQVLNVTSTFTLQREIKVKLFCKGIAYKDGKFAVNYLVFPGMVDILDIQGKVLHTIQPKLGKECILQLLCYITFGQENDRVIVSDSKTTNVHVLTFNGQILHTYTHDTLKFPQGIVITADGVLFVCSQENGCIHVVSPDFKTSKIPINNDNHVVDPRSITYCDTNHRLYISNTSRGLVDNEIQVYDMKEPV